MAILLVQIENIESLALNEFFDYSGSCYAISKSRYDSSESAIDLADFFEGSIRSKFIENIPVVFVYKNEEGKDVILGWYKNSTVYKEVKRPSLFLEGNIVANTADVVLLPIKDRVTPVNRRKNSYYEVIEMEDSRYDELITLIETYEGANEFLRYPFVSTPLAMASAKTVDACNTMCEHYASRILNNNCNSIIEIKLLETYSKRLIDLAPKSADGYYYQAMALCQLGFDKKAIKPIEKAIKIEPEASDLIAQKGIILCSMGYDKAAADCFEEAYKKSHDEQYLLLKGQAYMRCNEMDKAYECLKSIEDPIILEDAGIELKDMEKRWSFITIFRGKK